MATTALTPQNYFSTTLSSGITTTDTTVYLSSLPTGTEGYLEIDEGSASKEIIYYTSKGSNFVTLPSVGAGRGVGGTSAAAHLAGATVKMKLNAEWFLALKDGTAISDGVILPRHLMASTGTSWGWVSYTPTFTNLTVGNGTLVAKYRQVGKNIEARISLVFGTTTSVSADILASLPVTAAAYAGTGNITGIGVGNAYDTSATRIYPLNVNMSSTTAVSIRPAATDLTYFYTAIASSTVPFTWATGDEIGVSFFYEAA